MAYYTSYVRMRARVMRGEGRPTNKLYHIWLLKAEVGVVRDSEHDFFFLATVLGNIRRSFLRWLLLLVLRALLRDGSFDGRRGIALGFRLALLLCVRDLV